MDNLKTKAGTIYNIDRPAFKAGTKERCNCNNKKIDISKLNKRRGIGNYEIMRPSFEAPKIRPRIAGDFDKLQAIDIETQGAKIQLSDKTIAELFKTRVGDNTDNEWLQEKARLTGIYQARGMTPLEIEREIEVNKPLGREQRKITVSQNIGQSSLSVKDKIEEIKQEVVDGRAESRAQQAALIGQLALIFADTQALTQFTQQQLVGLSQTVARLNVPRDYKQMGLTFRYIDYPYYFANRGLINLFIFSNITSDPNFGPNGINYNKPIYNFAAHPNGIPTVDFSSMTRQMQKRPPVNIRYLDLERRGVINYAQMLAIVNGLPNGWDNVNISITQNNRQP